MGDGELERRSAEDAPSAEVRPPTRLSLVWLVPTAALAVVAYLAYTILSARGPTITITFETAEGLNENQTQVRYKAVTLGTVEDIRLSDDASHIIATVAMTDQAEPFLTESARFWVVRPRLSGGLSAFQAGLETLVSGAYVAIDPGRERGEPQRHFKGMENPPSVRSDEPGTVYYLKADSLAGLSAGAPIFLGGVEVGEVLSYELEERRENVELRVFVHEPYDRRIVPATRFWNTSGLRLAASPEGLRLEIQSARSLLSGGIAFHTPPEAASSPPAAPEATFQLYGNRALAEVGFYNTSLRYVSYFQSSVHGLGPGSEVYMFGQRVGSVTEVELGRDRRPGHDGELAVRVAYVLQPDRIVTEPERPFLTSDGLRDLVRDHTRVVLETSNFITGQKVLSLEYVAGSAPGEVYEEGDSIVLPSESRGLDEIPQAVSQVTNAIARIPFEEIGSNLNRTLAALETTVTSPEFSEAITNLNGTMAEVRELVREAKAGLGPALERLPRVAQKLEQAVDGFDQVLGRQGYGAHSTVQRNLESMMLQVADAARSVRLLTDYLNRHPEALLRGRGTGEP